MLNKYTVVGFCRGCKLSPHVEAESPNEAAIKAIELALADQWKHCVPESIPGVVALARRWVNGEHKLLKETAVYCVFPGWHEGYGEPMWSPDFDPFENQPCPSCGD